VFAPDLVENLGFDLLELELNNCFVKIESILNWCGISVKIFVAFVEYLLFYVSYDRLLS